MKTAIDASRVIPMPVEGGPYFGYPTFHDYYLSAARKGCAYEKLTEEQAWQWILKTLKRGVHISSAEFIREERRKNPRYRLKDRLWYFVMPEARATIPPDLLSEVDAAIGQ